MLIAFDDFYYLSEYRNIVKLIYITKDIFIDEDFLFEKLSCWTAVALNLVYTFMLKLYNQMNFCRVICLLNIELFSMHARKLYNDASHESLVGENIN